MILLLAMACQDPAPIDSGPVELDTAVLGTDTGPPCADEELACDGLDEDCDGVVDDGLLETFWVDEDGDGWGGEATVDACPSGGPGLVLRTGDCDDADPARHPEQFDGCDGVDEDCDGVVDEDAPVSTWYADLDGDGVGDEASAVSACARPDGAVTTAGDCDDGDPAVHPGLAETCGNDRDDDCDGAVDEVSVCCIATARGTDRFALCTEAMAWKDAQARCAADGATLVLPADADAHTWFWGLSTWLGQSLWIDLSDAADEGTWVRADGTAPTWLEWGSGQPADSDPDADCALLGASSGTWTAQSCDLERPFACALP
ncbi:MAG: hypothetical protein H6742_04125 [Alphaproteobacteria bacterium]|nr:hypothetical protein [Alphaproteobacteria bacterium]